LKPDNLLVGLGPHSHRIHIIDFGLAKQYRDPHTNIHIHYRDNLPMIGTARYSSINVQTGIEPSRRDDIESIAYILIYLMRGSLPWQGDKGGKRQADVRKKKLTTTPQDLCAGLPAEFELCLQYARSLGFSQRPNYQYLRELFSNLCDQCGNDKLELLTFVDRTLAPPGSDSTKTETGVEGIGESRRLVFTLIFIKNTHPALNALTVDYALAELNAT
jgi:serine/threonine protein kinase